MKVLGIIPARGGSKGIQRKNIKMLAGKPLLAHAIDAAKDSGILERIVVSTDDAEIADVAKQFGAEVLMRPEELAQDKTPTLPVLIHVVESLKREGYGADAVMLLQPTAPLRTGVHIQGAYDLFNASGADSVVSVAEIPDTHNPHWQFVLDADSRMSIFTGEDFKDIIARRQDLEKTYTREGAIYLFKTELLFRDPPSFYGTDVRAYVMDAAHSLNIDTPEDFALAELRLTGKAAL